MADSDPAHGLADGPTRRTNRRLDAVDRLFLDLVLLALVLGGIGLLVGAVAWAITQI